MCQSAQADFALLAPILTLVRCLNEANIRKDIIKYANYIPDFCSEVGDIFSRLSGEMSGGRSPQVRFGSLI